MGKAWKVGGKQVGKERKHGALSFVQVHRAGHMGPMDQPEVAMTMLNRFIANKALIMYVCYNDHVTQARRAALIVSKVHSTKALRGGLGSFPSHARCLMLHNGST